jgi:long-subunit acyl-CoA synthetase (AMP-forming)
MVSSSGDNAEKTVQVVYMGSETSDYGSALSYSQFLKRGKGVNQDQQQGRDVHVKPEDVCCFQFTSGTTGPRKASMLSHRCVC